METIITVLLIILVVCFASLFFATGVLYGLKHSDETFKQWGITIKKWEEDREYFQKSLELLSNKTNPPKTNS